MATDDPGSVTRWIGDLKAGDDAAAQPLWERYFERLVQLARAKLRATRRPGAVEDEEDAALSAFNSFCTGAARGSFPLLSDRDDLWRLLVVITARKACAQVQRRTRKKRGGGQHVLDERALAGAEPDANANALDLVIGDEPTPEFAAMVAEEYRRLLEALDDDTLRRVALDRMEGYTTDEIAERLGCARRTVARRLDLIRKIWTTPEEETP
ncbi:ECF-type sigma factor [Singulisphaera sp. PoT]|uniref:ECF-type sigma factor n=1 Tax=Singulisphaera sp. PoT TaxID=3411797 RepID=UPI003BF4CA20